uniref:Uncharacterized protein n=1 Tax=Rhizophora mucronata TaxID=61149 RepID=A0A2P2JWZ8_RHIMU
MYRIASVPSSVTL